MNEVSVSSATILASVIISNIAVLIGSYVSLKVALVRLETKADRFDKDINNLWNKFKNNNEKE